MTGHVVSFTPAGAPTRAVCSCGWSMSRLDHWRMRMLSELAEAHAWAFGPDARIEFAGLPPVERAS